MATRKKHLIFTGLFLAVSFVNLQRFRDSQDASQMPVEEQDKIMHVALPIGGNILMGTDVPDSMEKVTKGTNFSISIHADSAEQAGHLFNGLAAGGQVLMPLSPMFWGALFGLVTDRFGIQWMVNFDEKYA